MTGLIVLICAIVITLGVSLLALYVAVRAEQQSGHMEQRIERLVELLPPDRESGRLPKNRRTMWD